MQRQGISGFSRTRVKRRGFQNTYRNGEAQRFLNWSQVYTRSQPQVTAFLGSCSFSKYVRATVRSKVGLILRFYKWSFCCLRGVSGVCVCGGGGGGGNLG